MKKAQMIQSEIFIYILALVVTSLILLYGYNAVKKMRSQTDTVAIIEFKTELTNRIEQLSHEYGTVDIKTLSAPSGTKEVCFVYLGKYGGGPENNNDFQNNARYNLIKNNYAANTGDNIFILGDNIFEPFDAGAVSVEGDFKCFDVASGKIDVRLEAKGKTVYVS